MDPANSLKIVVPDWLETAASGQLAFCGLVGIALAFIVSRTWLANKKLEMSSSRSILFISAREPSINERPLLCSLFISRVNSLQNSLNSSRSTRAVPDWHYA